jgi:FMN phosphatase YigB (HAD superfamily)
MKPVLALDFDGLLCDGLNECVLVTWNGYHGMHLIDFSDEGLARIPIWFIERFKNCRNFAKHLGHFFVPFLERAASIRNQQDFEEVYQSIRSADIQEFVKKVSSYRNWARQEKTEEWLRYHQLYPGMAEFLASVTLPTYIVTAKDANSVIAILKHNGFHLEKRYIFGELQSKIAALREIEHLENIESKDIHFYDDNLPNVMEARQSGYHAIWAIWGYNTEDHFNTASRYNIPSVDLKAFLSEKLNRV